VRPLSRPRHGAARGSARPGDTSTCARGRCRRSSGGRSRAPTSRRLGKKAGSRKRASRESRRARRLVKEGCREDPLPAQG
jgi:hypothetical protein